MRALVRQGVVKFVERPVPARGPAEALVAVRSAGICRTDVYVADGTLEVDEPRTLGHEAAGVVMEASDTFEPGERVVIDPALACDACAACANECPCRQPTMLGVHRDGAFADVVCVPTRSLTRLPDGVGWNVGAMAEPVAAALGVLRAPIRPGRGAVYGTGRVASLIVRVLDAAGLSPMPWSDELGDLEWVVEATTMGDALDRAMSALVPGGTLVLKSRPPNGASLDVAYAVRNELTLVARSYGKFADAVRWLDRLKLDDLVGDVFPFEQFETAFEAARKDERRKIFLSPGPEL